MKFEDSDLKKHSALLERIKDLPCLITDKGSILPRIDHFLADDSNASRAKLITLFSLWTERGLLQVDDNEEITFGQAVKLPLNSDETQVLLTLIKKKMQKLFASADSDLDSLLDQPGVYFAQNGTPSRFVTPRGRKIDSPNYDQRSGLIVVAYDQKEVVCNSVGEILWMTGKNEKLIGVHQNPFLIITYNTQRREFGYLAPEGVTCEIDYSRYQQVRLQDLTGHLEELANTGPETTAEKRRKHLQWVKQHAIDNYALSFCIAGDEEREDLNGIIFFKKGNPVKHDDETIFFGHEWQQFDTGYDGTCTLLTDHGWILVEANGDIFDYKGETCFPKLTRWGNNTTIEYEQGKTLVKPNGTAVEFEGETVFQEVRWCEGVGALITKDDKEKFIKINGEVSSFGGQEVFNRISYHPEAPDFLTFVRHVGQPVEVNIGDGETMPVPKSLVAAKIGEEEIEIHGTKWFRAVKRNREDGSIEFYYKTRGQKRMALREPDGKLFELEQQTEFDVIERHFWAGNESPFTLVKQSNGKYLLQRKDGTFVGIDGFEEFDAIGVSYYKSGSKFNGFTQSAIIIGDHYYVIDFATGQIIHQGESKSSDFTQRALKIETKEGNISFSLRR